MWIRLRLDISWTDLFFGFRALFTFRSRNKIQRDLEEFWSCQKKDSLATLSVRSGFDLLLTALELPPGSEILFSAVTLADMPKIAKEHHLIPVPVDLIGADFQIDIESMKAAISPRTKVLVVAHLFGVKMGLDHLFELAHQHNIIVIEDCAQAWHGNNWRGDLRAKASLFSFGTIKTATALGGGLCRISDQALLERMRKIQSEQHIYSSTSFFKKLCQTAVLKFLSGKIIFHFLTKIANVFRVDWEQTLAKTTRGFAAGNLMQQIRQQPSLAMLSLLDHRIKNYPLKRIQHRTENARQVISSSDLIPMHSELLNSFHTFWVLPLMFDSPEKIRKALKEKQIDSARQGRLIILEPPENRPELVCSQAMARLEKIVCVPCYPEFSAKGIETVSTVLKQHCTKK